MNRGVFTHVFREEHMLLPNEGVILDQLLLRHMNVPIPTQPPSHNKKKIVSSEKMFLTISLNCIPNEYTASNNRHISSEVDLYTTNAFIMSLSIIATFVLFYWCVTSDSDRIAHAKTSQCFVSA